MFAERYDQYLEDRPTIIEGRLIRLVNESTIFSESGGSTHLPFLGIEPKPGESGGGYWAWRFPGGPILEAVNVPYFVKHNYAGFTAGMPCWLLIGNGEAVSDSWGLPDALMGHRAGAASGSQLEMLRMLAIHYPTLWAELTPGAPAPAEDPFIKQLREWAAKS